MKVSWNPVSQCRWVDIFNMETTYPIYPLIRRWQLRSKEFQKKIYLQQWASEISCHPSVWLTCPVWWIVFATPAVTNVKPNRPNFFLEPVSFDNIVCHCQIHDFMIHVHVHKLQQDVEAVRGLNLVSGVIVAKVLEVDNSSFIPRSKDTLGCSRSRTCRGMSCRDFSIFTSFFLPTWTNVVQYHTRPSVRNQRSRKGIYNEVTCWWSHIPLSTFALVPFSYSNPALMAIIVQSPSQGLTMLEISVSF